MYRKTTIEIPTKTMNGVNFHSFLRNNYIMRVQLLKSEMRLIKTADKLTD